MCYSDFPRDSVILLPGFNLKFILNSNTFQIMDIMTRARLYLTFFCFEMKY